MSWFVFDKKEDLSSEFDVAFDLSGQPGIGFDNIEIEDEFIIIDVLTFKEKQNELTDPSLNVSE